MALIRELLRGVIIAPIDIPVRRLRRWLNNFHNRHDIVATHYFGETVEFSGNDGERAILTVPFGSHGMTDNFDEFNIEPLFSHLEKPRTVGVLLARRGGYAVGIFNPNDELIASKVGSRLVHSRHKKGGSSQKRFSRRRDNEVRALITEATNVAIRILASPADSIDAVITGGDRHIIQEILNSPELADIHARVTPPWLPVPNPKATVLRASPNHFRSIRAQRFV